MKKSMLLVQTVIFAVILGLGGISCFANDGSIAGPANTRSTGKALKPNIVLINLDDADYELFTRVDAASRFPHIKTLAANGVTFDNMHATTPFCGPSRASLYRGQYAHNTGIKVNDPNATSSNNFGGGFPLYLSNGYMNNDLGTWMKDQGYRTMLVGKYLHHGFNGSLFSAPFPNWDDFYGTMGDWYYEPWQYKYEVGFKPRVWERIEPNVYRTTRELEQSLDLIDFHVAERPGQPFFININPIGPHSTSNQAFGMIDKSKYMNSWPNVTQPPSVAFNETNFADKRGGFWGAPELDASQVAWTAIHHRERMLATRSIDDMVGAIVAAVPENTYIFVTSDNGFALGHHRMVGKGAPTHRSTNVPCIVSGPGVPAGATAHHLLGHIDLAPTIVDLAGGTAPALVDGISFADLITDPQSTPVSGWRQHLLIENWATLTNITGAQMEWAGTTLRMVDQVYTEWANGQSDWYSLTADPEQINNFYDYLDPTYKAYLATSLRNLKSGSTDLPVAKFSSPFDQNSGELFPSGGYLYGIAEDPEGVSRVEIGIYNPQYGYWDGNSWQASPQFFPVTIDNVGGQMTRWRYQFTPPSVPTGPTTAFIWAYDSANTTTNPPPFVRFTVVGN